jgi:transposase-like protein
MALVHVQCPQCQRIDVVQYGQQANGTQRYCCNNPDCPRTIFLLQYHDKGRLPAVKQQIVDMTLNGSGVRDIVRVLRVSSATVIDVLKKKSRPSSRCMKGCSAPLILRVVFQKWRWPFLYRPSKGIAVDKQADNDVVHLGRFRKADGLADQAFHACP